jgi:hypothetical protein
VSGLLAQARGEPAAADKLGADQAVWARPADADAVGTFPSSPHSCCGREALWGIGAVAGSVCQVPGW